MHYVEYRKQILEPIKHTAISFVPVYGFYEVSGVLVAHVLLLASGELHPYNSTMVTSIYGGFNRLIREEDLLELRSDKWYEYEGESSGRIFFKHYGD